MLRSGRPKDGSEEKGRSGAYRSAEIIVLRLQDHRISTWRARGGQNGTETEEKLSGRERRKRRERKDRICH